MDGSTSGAQRRDAFAHVELELVGAAGCQLVRRPSVLWAHSQSASHRQLGTRSDPLRPGIESGPGAHTGLALRGWLPFGVFGSPSTGTGRRFTRPKASRAPALAGNRRTGGPSAAAVPGRMSVAGEAPWQLDAPASQRDSHREPLLDCTKGARLAASPLRDKAWNAPEHLCRV
jgi:hypothetical protein